MEAPHWLVRPVDGIPTWKLAVRLTVIAVELILVLWFGQNGAYFIYQGF